ncbi:hypothetical protein QFZ25_000521 [Bacillus atrophaeus]|nr:CPBP family intramembrane glutamic endopeptidase [Bacillus atrophaeus]MDQ0926461.1 hypothetical protein [Bacillus atrophaeus]
MLLDYLIYIIIFAIVMISINLIRTNLRNFRYADILRTLFFYMPFLLPMVYYGIPPLRIAITLNYFIGLILAIGGTVIGLILQYEKIKPFFSKELYELLPPLSYKWFLIIEISLFASVICEEIFYRYYLPESNTIIDYIICGVLFSLAHFIDKYTRSEFTLKSYSILFFLSICWLLSFKVTHSILPAMLGHLLYNLPRALSTLYQYRMSSKKKSIELSS